MSLIYNLFGLSTQCVNFLKFFPDENIVSNDEFQCQFTSDDFMMLSSSEVTSHL